MAPQTQRQMLCGWAGYPAGARGSDPSATKSDMELPVLPPVSPMLGKLARELPVDGFLYEPKWDGFRCLAFRDHEDVDLRSRNDRPLARYFPELVDGLRALSEERFVLDGEIVVVRDGSFDFEALLARLHPAAARVERLRLETPASFMAFDVLAIGDDDLRERSFEERRALLSVLLDGEQSPIRASLLTDDVAVASGWLDEFQGAGIDGVVAKHRTLRYRPGARAMVKVKRERTADCVVAGFRYFVDRPVLSSLLLGMYDDDGELQHVGVVTQLPERRRRELLEELADLAVPLEGHPWERGFLLSGSPVGRLKGAAGRWSPEEMEQDWVALAPVRVCEVAYDHVDRQRFRHPARFRRWRPDKDARDCSLDQLETPAPELEEILGPA
jgi:ATP-dependent DNA ligase